MIELLVVVAVIGMLASLLLVAVNRSRETARRAQCITRQCDLAKAMITYANDCNGLPGYLNQLGETPIHSWAIAIFPMIGENKRYEVMMSWTSGTQVPADALVTPPTLLCPSDNPQDPPGRLNYVVNCGPVEENGIDVDAAIARALFRDRRTNLTTINTKVKIEDIPNGASNTILLSENLNAGVWWFQGGTPNEWKKGDDFTRDRTAVDNFGFIWSLGRDRAYAPNSPASALHPRPSSVHPGAVIVAYADGKAQPWNDDVDINVYLKAVNPNANP